MTSIGASHERERRRHQWFVDDPIRSSRAEEGSMRSFLAGVAALWFAVNALTFLPEFGVFTNPEAPGGLDGETAAVAVTQAARALFAGLTIISLAVIDWTALMRRIRGT
jgi:hypothetical protein